MPAKEKGESVGLESLNWELIGMPPTISPIIVSYQDVLRSYRKFPTAQSLERIATLQRVRAALADQGSVVDILVGGSLVAGQSTDKSDIDVFAVAVETPGLDQRDLKSDIQQGIDQELGKPALSDHLIHFFDVGQLSDYLASGRHVDDLKHPNSPSAINRWWKIYQFYRYHYISLGIGDCRLGLVGKIEELQAQEPLIAKSLRMFQLPSFQKYYENSFAKWRGRLINHPDFLSQPEAERTQYLLDLGDKERQFLFYFQFPQYSV